MFSDKFEKLKFCVLPEKSFAKTPRGIRDLYFKW